MDCTIHNEEGYSIIRLSGEVDMSTSPKARKAILACLKKQQNLFIDLSEVGYIDSSGLASLVEGYQYARGHGLRFILIGVGEFAKNVLQLARLDRVFPIYASVEQWKRTEGLTGTL